MMASGETTRAPDAAQKRTFDKRLEPYSYIGYVLIMHVSGTKQFKFMLARTHTNHYHYSVTLLSKNYDYIIV